MVNDATEARVIVADPNKEGYEVLRRKYAHSDDTMVVPLAWVGRCVKNKECGHRDITPPIPPSPQGRKPGRA